MGLVTTASATVLLGLVVMVSAVPLASLTAPGASMDIAPPVPVHLPGAPDVPELPVTLPLVPGDFPAEPPGYDTVDVPDSILQGLDSPVPEGGAGRITTQWFGPLSKQMPYPCQAGAGAPFVPRAHALLLLFEDAEIVPAPRLLDTSNLPPDLVDAPIVMEDGTVKRAEDMGGVVGHADGTMSHDGDPQYWSLPSDWIRITGHIVPVNIEVPASVELTVGNYGGHGYPEFPAQYGIEITGDPGHMTGTYSSTELSPQAFATLSNNGWAFEIIMTKPRFAGSVDISIVAEAVVPGVNGIVTDCVSLDVGRGATGNILITDDGFWFNDYARSFIVAHHPPSGCASEYGYHPECTGYEQQEWGPSQAQVDAMDRTLCARLAVPMEERGVILIPPYGLAEDRSLLDLDAGDSVPADVMARCDEVMGG